MKSIAEDSPKISIPTAYEIRNNKAVSCGIFGIPKEIREKARQSYKQFRTDPYHASLHFKQVHPVKPIYSVRITLGYRAIGVLQNGQIVWFWLGAHAEYDKLTSRL